MYPLNMHNAEAGGYAVANTEHEHRTLTEHGYQPAFVDPASDEESTDEVTAEAPKPRGRPPKAKA